MWGKGLGFLMGVGALVFSAGACEEDSSSLGQRPDDASGSGGAAGDGGAAGSAVASQCSAPNPAGCGESAPCPQGSICLERDAAACAPSSCQCVGAGDWSCTDDCVTPRQCVPSAPLSSSSARVFHACTPSSDTIGLLVGEPAKACSEELAYPVLVLPFRFESVLGEIPVGEPIPVTAGHPEGDTDLPRLGVYRPTESSPPLDVKQGTMTFTSRDYGSRVTGRYEVELVDGRHLVGDFDAEWCRPQVSC